MTKLFAAERVRARLRHVVVCRNGKGQPKEKIAQNKRARAGSFAIVYRVSNCLSQVLHLFGCVSFSSSLISLKPWARLFVLRDTCASTATRSHLTTICVLLLCVCVCFRLWKCRFFRLYFVSLLPFSLCMESTSYVFHSGWCFFTL